MTVEELAREYSDSKGIYNEHGERLLHMGYLAGHNEAMRWRDPKVERPGKALPVVVKYETSGGHVKYWVEEYSYGRFAYDADDIGAKIIGWRPIE